MATKRVELANGRARSQNSTQVWEWHKTCAICERNLCQLICATREVSDVRAECRAIVMARVQRHWLIVLQASAGVRVLH